jgi:hypothetical protein
MLAPRDGWLKLIVLRSMTKMTFRGGKRERG